MTDFILPIFLILVWVKIDRDERKLNRHVKPKKKKPVEDIPVIYKARC